MVGNYWTLGRLTAVKQTSCFTSWKRLPNKKSLIKSCFLSGDGDYFKIVQYLITKNKFEKLLAPNKKSMSSLYRPFSPKFTDFLDRPALKRKFAAQNGRKQSKQKTGSS